MIYYSLSYFSADFDEVCIKSLHVKMPVFQTHLLFNVFPVLFCFVFWFNFISVSHLITDKICRIISHLNEIVVVWNLVLIVFTDKNR